MKKDMKFIASIAICGSALLLFVFGGTLLLTEDSFRILGWVITAFSVLILIFFIAKLAKFFHKSHQDTLKKIVNLENKLEQINKYTSQVEFRTRNTEAFKTQVIKKQDSIAEKINSLPSLTSTSVTSAAITHDVEEKQLGYFYPNRLQAVLPPKLNENFIAGRQAAAVTSTHRSREYMNELLRELDEEPLPVVTILSGSSVNKTLIDLCHIKYIHPGELNDFNDSTYILIDFSAFRQGVWSGTLAAPSTHIYNSLANSLTSARKEGKIVIIIDDGNPWDNFGFDLSSRSDIVVKNGKFETNYHYFNDDMSTPLFDSIRKFSMRDAKHA